MTVSDLISVLSDLPHERRVRIVITKFDYRPFRAINPGDEDREASQFLERREDGSGTLEIVFRQ